MTTILNDNEIQNLINGIKILPSNWQTQLRPKSKSGFQYEERSLTVKGENNNTFRVILRRNKLNAFDFSIILIFQEKDGKEYRLVRYNGKHPSKHTNSLEKQTFGPAFHIHRATQRYQEYGLIIDKYAEETTSYYDFNSALTCFLKDNNFIKPESSQTQLFENGELL